MDTTKWNYFQYRKAHGYPVYLRFTQDGLHAKFLHVIKEMGFEAITELESKKIQLTKTYTRVLTVQESSARLQQLINGSDILDQFGAESLSLRGGVPVYTYRKVGIMGLPFSKPCWELAVNEDISQTDQMVGLRVILVRFLIQSLADQGVLAYWGTIQNEKMVVMKQLHSFGEAVFIDVNKRLMFSNGGEMKLESTLKIIRKDKESPFAKAMNREELISFLSVSTCLLSFSGITQSMKKAIYELSTRATASYAASENSATV